MFVRDCSHQFGCCWLIVGPWLFVSALGRLRCFRFLWLLMVTCACAVVCLMTMSVDLGALTLSVFVRCCLRLLVV